MADAYLPVWVRDLPIDMLVRGREVRPDIRHLVDAGVVRVVAGPEHAHVMIDIKRPYHLPPRRVEAGFTDGVPA